MRSPTNGATEVSLSPTIEVDVTDPEAGDVQVSLYGRLAGGATPGPDFTIVVLPDTQFYSESYPQIFLNQVNWIIANRTNLNIVYVGHVGDIVNQGDSQPYQWNNATNALYRLLDPALTGTPNGIPLGVVPGNHDHVGGITLYNQFMGLSVFSNRSWYGGNMGSDNRNHYDLLTASGLDFLFLYTDFNYSSINYGPIDAWANSVLAAHPNRRAMILTHCILTTSSTYDSSRSPNLYSTVGANHNVFLMVCGHNHGESYRVETNGNHIVHIALADYQSDPNGGNGWLRLYKFSPANNRINVETYSPTLNSNRTAASGQFTISYPMSEGAGAPFFLVGTTNVPPGATASFPWPGLSPGTNYEWYVVINDGTNSTTSATNRFSTVATGSNLPPTVTLTSPTDRQRFAAGSNVALAADASDAGGLVTRVEFLVNGNKLGEDTAAPYEFTWNNIPAGDHQLRAVAHDSGGAFTTSTVVRVSAVTPPGSTNTLVAAGSVWKYLDNGSDQGTAWRAPGYDDSAWASGVAPLGYGDPWIVTTVSYGPNSSSKYITTYFRKTIIVTNAASYASLNLRVQRDDGIAAYLNGVGCYTNNLPATFDYRTLAPTIIDGANETNWVGATLPANLLVEGTNVVCAEVHQRDGTSSDLTFNLELTGVIQGELDLTPPSVPTGMQAVSPATNAVQLSWTSSTDNDGGSGVAGYEIYRAGSLIGSNSPALFIDTPVDPGTAHCYRVAAYL